ncbi:MAG: SDR family NAD(P)-dependent oxidoreductase [Sediminispirochaetaceae bacterium]
MNDVNGQKYIVVGGSSGIGLQIAADLIELGAEVQVWSRNRSEELDRQGIQHVTVDVLEDIGAIEVPENIDGLVYCPGTIQLGQFKRLTIDQFRSDFEINLLGAVRVIQFLEKPLKAGGGGSVVLFSTVAVQTGMVFHSSVAAAKGAVEGLVRSLAAEYAVSNIRVNAVAPSITDTPLASRILANEKQRQASAERHPLKRIGTADDIAAGVTYLLGPSSAWITGQILHIDGGLSALR